MPQIAAGALIAGGTIWAANKASSSANKASDAAMSAAQGEKATNYGSHLNQNQFGQKDIGRTVIDPSIRSLREQALGRLPQYRADINNSGNSYLNSIDQSRAELESNQNPFIQARVNPLLASA